jgi:hypothetical protein
MQRCAVRALLLFWSRGKSRSFRVVGITSPCGTRRDCMTHEALENRLARPLFCFCHTASHVFPESGEVNGRTSEWPCVYKAGYQMASMKHPFSARRRRDLESGLAPCSEIASLHQRPTRVDSLLWKAMLAPSRCQNCKCSYIRSVCDCHRRSREVGCALLEPRTRRRGRIVHDLKHCKGVSARVVARRSQTVGAGKAGAPHRKISMAMVLETPVQ